MTIKTITGIELYQSDVETAKECIEQAAASGVCLDNADFCNLDLEGISLIGQSLQWCNFENANVSLSDLRACNLSNSNLRRSTFFNSNLQGAYMRDVDMNGTNFSGANLQSVDFRTNTTVARKVQKTLFINTNLQSATFDKIHFWECDFSNTNFKNSSIRFTEFKECNLELVNFTASKFHRITICESILTKSNFYNVDMTKCELYSCDISDSYLGYTTILMNCGFRNNKTTEIQRTFLASFMYSWLERADNLSDYERKLKDFIAEYASEKRYSEVHQHTINLQNEFVSYVEPPLQD